MPYMLPGGAKSVPALGVLVALRWRCPLRKSYRAVMFHKSLVLRGRVIHPIVCTGWFLHKAFPALAKPRLCLRPGQYVRCTRGIANIDIVF